MTSSDRGVPRGDHVPASEQQASIEAQNAETLRGENARTTTPSEQGASGAARVEPDATKGSDRGGTSGFGGAPAGGSVIDTRGKQS
jgi:hypothetical protein